MLILVSNLNNRRLYEIKSKIENIYKLFKNISEENKKYKLQIDTIEALKKQFKKEIDISFKRGEAITEEMVKTNLEGLDKLLDFYLEKNNYKGGVK